MFVSGWKWYSGIKDGPLPSPAVLWIVSVWEENPDRKKIQKCWRPNLAANTTLNAKIMRSKMKYRVLLTTAALNTKTNEVKNKIPNITDLATLTDV